MILIACVTPTGGIGFQGKIPWDCKEDRIQFQKKTIGNTICLGRTSFEEIGKPLVKRLNIVVSSTMKKQDGFLVVPSLERAYILHKGISSEIDVGNFYVCGGQSLYEAALPLATKVELTILEKEYTCDKFFPKLDQAEWKEVARQHIPGLLSFVTYERK